MVRKSTGDGGDLCYGPGDAEKKKISGTVEGKKNNKVTPRLKHFLPEKQCVINSVGIKLRKERTRSVETAA